VFAKGTTTAFSAITLFFIVFAKGTRIAFSASTLFFIVSTDAPTV
jgi:hypothetical protein